MGAKIASLVLRAIVAAVFVYAGVMKIWDLQHWGSATQDFFQAVLNFHLTSWDVAMAIAVYLPWLEVLAGVALFVMRLREGALLLTAVMTLVFLGALGSAWWRGLDITCGCFGREGNATDFPVAMTRDAALLAAILGAWWVEIWWRGRGRV